MANSNPKARRILSAGIGVAALTALGGLACGNPVEPRCPPAGCMDAAVDTVQDAPGDAAEAIDAAAQAAAAVADTPAP